MEKPRPTWTDERLDDLSGRVTRMDDRLTARMDKIDARLASIDATLHGVQRSIIYVFGTAVTICVAIVAAAGHV